MATTITPTIVTINPTMVRAPTPSTLQQSGAFVSVGGSTLAAGTFQYVSQPSDVTAILSTTGNHAELSKMAATYFAQGNAVGAYVLELGSSGTESVDVDIAALQTWISANPNLFYAYLCPASWGITIDEVGAVIMGVAGTTYVVPPTVTFSAPGGSGVTATGHTIIQNGSVIQTVIDNPGSGYSTAPTATYSLPPVIAAPIQAAAATSTTGGTLAATTYYYVVTATTAFGETIASNEKSITTTGSTSSNTITWASVTGATGYKIYRGTATGVENVFYTVGAVTTFLDTGAANTAGTPPVTNTAALGATATGTPTLTAAIDALANQYSAPSGKTYFFLQCIAADLPSFATNKAVFAVVPSPTAVSTEFQPASFFYDWLVNNPSASNKLAPMAYRYQYGVTPWVQSANSATINNILSAYGNLIGTGAEGGISNAISFKGTLMDGSQASWWYGIDWFQIQVKQALAAAIINGSNSNPPLLYDQNGINTLLGVAQQVGNNTVTFGCALSVTITAIPFFTYQQQNPTSYAAGYYGGFSATVVGQNGFLTLTFNLEAVQFVA